MAEAQKTTAQPELLTVGEAAVLLRCSKVTVYRRVADGELKPVQFGEKRALLFSRSALLKKLGI